jgi:hypothetical protein
MAAVALVAKGGTELKSATTAAIAVTLVGAAIAIAAVLVAPTPRRRWGAVSLGLLAGLAAWTALSIYWSITPADSWMEANRTVSYVAAFGGAIGMARLAPERGRGIITAVLVACLAVCVVALFDKAFPGASNSTASLARLREPLGYWNALGALCAVAAVVALGLAARAVVVVPVVAALVLRQAGGVVGRVRIGRPAGDRVALELLRVVDLLALDRDGAVLVVLERGRAELLGRPLVIAGGALRAAVGDVLRLAGRPILELLGRVVLLFEAADLLLGLLGVLLLLARAGGAAVLLGAFGLLGLLVLPHAGRVPARRLTRNGRELPALRPSHANPSRPHP